MFCVFVQAHLSAFSLLWSSFQPSWTLKKLSGSVTASEYSCPTTMLQLSKMPLPKALLVAFTLCSPQPLAERRPVGVLPRDERVLDPVRVAEAVQARRLRVVAAVDGLARRRSCPAAS